jgi:GTPase
LPTSIPNWVEQIRRGDLQALSRAITTVENRAPESRPLLQALFAYAGRARVVGLTGAPGVGKSTLADALARHYRQRGQSVAIVAVDPTSPLSGGAILGDRIRMQAQTADEGTFIRSMASRGALGGLAATTADVVTVLDASGRDVVLIETVGAGQSQVEIAGVAEITAVVLVPGMGDEVQAIKAGMMEIADVYVINKAEREGAARLEQELRAMLSLGSRTDGWHPAVVRTVATSGEGVEQLAGAIEAFAEFLAAGELGRLRRAEHWRARLHWMLHEEILRRLDAPALSDGAISDYAAQVARGERDPYTLIAELADRALAHQLQDSSRVSTAAIDEASSATRELGHHAKKEDESSC